MKNYRLLCSMLLLLVFTCSYSTFSQAADIAVGAGGAQSSSGSFSSTANDNYITGDTGGAATYTINGPDTLTLGNGGRLYISSNDYPAGGYHSGILIIDGTLATSGSGSRGKVYAFSGGQIVNNGIINNSGSMTFEDVNNSYSGSGVFNNSHNVYNNIFGGTMTIAGNYVDTAAASFYSNNNGSAGTGSTLVLQGSNNILSGYFLNDQYCTFINDTAANTTFTSTFWYDGWGEVFNKGIITNQASIALGGTDFHYNFTNEAGATFTNVAGALFILGHDSTNQIGGTFINNGQFVNKGVTTFTNYSGTGTFSNILGIGTAGTVINNVVGGMTIVGQFINDTGTSFTNNTGLTLQGTGNSINASFINTGALTNSGTTTFLPTAVYSGAGAVSNAGTIAVDAGMSGLTTMITNTTLNNASSFALNASSNASLGAVSFAGAVSGSSLNLSSATGSTLTLTGPFDAKNASATFTAGTLALANGALLSSGSGFNLNSGAKLTAAGTAGVTASNFIVNGSLDTLNSATRLNITGDATINSGSNLSFYATAGQISKMNVSGKVVTQGGSVRLDGTTADVLNGGDFITYGSGPAPAAANLQSMIYKFENYGSGIRAVARNPTKDIVVYNIGEENISVNKVNGAIYVDKLLGGVADELEIALNSYVNDIEAISPGPSRVAFGQLFGEYGAEALTASLSSRANLMNSINRQLQQVQNSRLFPREALANAPGGGDAWFASAGNMPTRIWGGGFGSWTKQNGRSAISGYESNSGGALLGYERQLGNFDLGLAASYSRNEMEMNDLATDFDANIVDFGLYGRYNHSSGFFADLVLGYGYGSNKYEVDVITGGAKKGNYNSQTFTAGGDVGYIFRLPGETNIIPSLGLEYIYAHNSGWTEDLKGEAEIANWFKANSESYIRLPLAVRANKRFVVNEDVALIPEARVGWTYLPSNERPQVRTGFEGTSSSMTVYGVDPGHSLGTAGAGLKAQIYENVEFGVEYNYEFRESYRNHNLMGSVGVAF